MKSNDQSGKLTISEMLKKIKEQVEQIPDEPEAESGREEDAPVPPSEDGRWNESAPALSGGGEGKIRYRFRVTKRRGEGTVPAAEKPEEVAVPDAFSVTGELPMVDTLPTLEELPAIEEIPPLDTEWDRTQNTAVIEPIAGDTVSFDVAKIEEEAQGNGGEEPTVSRAETAFAPQDEEDLLPLPALMEEMPEPSVSDQSGDTAETARVRPISDLPAEPVGETAAPTDAELAADAFDAILYGEDRAINPDYAWQEGDTRPIDAISDPGQTTVRTLEFEPIEDADPAGDTLLPLSEPSDFDAIEALMAKEAYTPHGAQATMEDTGDITYDFGDRHGMDENETTEPDEELVPPEVDETDVNLMIAFGMDDELAKTIDEDRREQVEQELSDMEKELSEPEEEAFEYTSVTQNKSLFQEYRKKYGTITIKVAACAVLLLITFIYENISAFGGQLADAISPTLYPVTHIMVDLQLVLLGGALLWRRILDGVKALVRLRPTPDSLLSLLLTLTVIYDIGMCFLPYGSQIYLYGFPMLLGMMGALIFELFNLRREIFSFNIVASKRIKFAMGRLDAKQAKLEQEAFADYLPQDPNIFKLNKAAFIDGFYNKMKPDRKKSRIIALLMIFTLALTAAMLGLGSVWTGDFVKGITIGYAALMMSLPMAVYLTYSLPFYRASRIAYEQDSAILGEGAIDEYAEASSVSFDDRDVFPSYGVKVRSIKVFGSNRIDTIIYNAASVFRIAGGPLSDVFDIATAELGHSEDVRLLSVEPDGIEAVVSGTHLYFGKDEYLRRHHFTPLVDDDDGQVGSASIMYMVSDEEVVAKMYIQYRIDPDFESTLKQLYRYGICVGIKTLDPNIDDEMLSRRIKLNRYPVRILKCHEAEDSAKVLEHADSRLVSKHSAKALLKAFTLCSKVQRMIRMDTAINVIAMIVGVLIMLLSLVFGAAWQIPSFYIALYQLFWALPMALLSNMMIQ